MSKIELNHSNYGEFAIIDFLNLSNSTSLKTCTKKD